MQWIQIWQKLDVKDYRTNNKRECILNFAIDLHSVSCTCKIMKNGGTKHFTCSAWWMQMVLWIAILKKLDSDLCFCWDYELNANHKLCSHSYPIPDIESTLYSKARMNCFAKIDIKNCLLPNPNWG